jgi:hypothetical protein
VFKARSKHTSLKCAYYDLLGYLCSRLVHNTLVSHMHTQSSRLSVFKASSQHNSLTYLCLVLLGRPMQAQLSSIDPRIFSSPGLSVFKASSQHNSLTYLCLVLLGRPMQAQLSSIDPRIFSSPGLSVFSDSSQHTSLTDAYSVLLGYLCSRLDHNTLISNVHTMFSSVICVQG